MAGLDLNIASGNPSRTSFEAEEDSYHELEDGQQEKRASKSNGMALNMVSASPSRVESDDDSSYHSMEGGDPKVFNGERGVTQPHSYKDWTIAVAFFAHLAFYSYPFVRAWMADAYNNNYGYGGLGYSTVVFFIMYCAVFATVASVGLFVCMLHLPGKWIKSTLVGSLNIFLGSAAVAFFREEGRVFIMMLMTYALASLYVAYNWKRIPVRGGVTLLYISC